MNSSVDKILLVIKEEKTVFCCSLFISSIKGKIMEYFTSTVLQQIEDNANAAKKGNKLPVLLQLNPSFHPAETADKCILRQMQK